MTANNMPHRNYEKYRRVRALEFLRVSTPEQEKNFGWPRQHQANKEMLIDPLELRVVGQIKDSYTGLDFQMHDALDEALRRAKNGEYDILIMDMLDRLGRKGLEREIYLLELKQAGVRAVSADPEDHSDDDTSWGEIIRYLKGKAAEDEVKNIRYRTMGGRRAKAMGDPEKGVEPQIVGNGHRYYGYKYVIDERGKRVGITPNHDIITVDEDGVEWTEVKVVIFIFESAANSVTLHQIIKILNEKGLPPPYVAKGIKRRKAVHTLWQPSSPGRILQQSAYWGEARFNKMPSAGKIPGKKDSRRKTSEKEQIVVPVPAIVSKDLAETAQKKVKQNQDLSKRNNPYPEETLLRGGFARCGLCNSALRIVRVYDKKKDGTEKKRVIYRCGMESQVRAKCKGCAIFHAHYLDDIGWKKVIELINDPKEIDERVAKERKKDPTAERRNKLNERLRGIRDEQSALQEYLSERIRKRTLDSKTEARLSKDLHQLANEEEECESLLVRDINEHEKWKRVQKKLDELHQECTEMRELLRDPNYDPPYQRKRDLLAFFGIRVKVFTRAHEKPVQVECNPPDIVSLLSSLKDLQHRHCL